ncbi:MAG: PAS domain S-box protein [Myxococcota bacterium]
MTSALDIEKVAEKSSASLEGPVFVVEWLAEEGWPVEYVSENIQDVLGYDPDTLTSGNMLWEQVIHPDDRERMRAECAENVASGKTHGVLYHYRAVGAEGQVYLVEEVNRIVRDEQGEVIRYIGHVVDVTEKRRAEARLRQREAALEEALQIAQLGHWVWDLRSDEVSWSDELYHLLGLDPAEVEPSWEASMTVVHPEDREAVDESFNQAYSGLKPWNMVYRIMRPEDGEVRYLRGRGRSISEGGEPTRVVGTVQDITENVRAEEVLQSRRFWLETLIDAIPDMICFKDAKGRWTVANEVLLDFFGISGVDYRGKTDSEIAKFSEHCQGGLVQLGRTDEAAWASRAEFNIEERLERDDGQKRCILDVTKVPLFEADGSRKAMVWVARDVTERRRTEEELRKSRARLAEAQRIASLGNWELDLRTGQVLWSDETFRIFGLEPGQESVDLDFLGEFMEGGVASIKQDIEKALQQGREFSLDHRIETAQGEPRIIHTTGRVVRREDGEPALINGVVRDVTDVREAESLKRRLGRILDESSNEILVIDADTLEFLQANRGAKVNLGYTDEELRQMTPMDLSPTLTSRDRFEALVEPLRNGSKELISYEGKHVRADGSSYPVEVRLQLSRSEDPPVFLSIVQDITERRKVERLKEEFVSVVSHELRTPLTPISGVLSLLSSGRGGELSDRAQQMVDLALRNSKRLLFLIDDLLDLRKLSSDQMEFRLRALDVGAVVEDAVRVNETLGDEMNVDFEVSVLDEGLRVRADKERLTQVLTNLMVNAAKFSPDSSTVEIRVEQRGDCARVSVVDQGPGISEKFRPRVFEKFAQADSSSTRAHGGTGLGLSICKSIIERLDGRIDFKTEVGEGSTFFFELPRMDEPDAE